MRAIELFAGIGGLRLAAGGGMQVVAAYDQDRAAGVVHSRNAGMPVIAVDLASVTVAELRRHDAEGWLLSPPCQPFTRRGARRDIDDPRCAGLLRLIALLPECRPRRILVENVPGFHGSRAHARLVAALQALGHDVADVEACPTEFGAPVRRRRQFVVSSVDGLAATQAPPLLPRKLESYLDAAPDPSLRLPSEVRARVADHFAMPGPDGVAGTFTRSYGRAISGAGPVLWDEQGPRYFAPEEILRLHDFPPSFTFPDAMDRRTRWRLACNSVHVGCASHVASMLGQCA
jgi:site-specific DNA-cytosine methylase